MATVIFHLKTALWVWVFWATCILCYFWSLVISDFLGNYDWWYWRGWWLFFRFRDRLSLVTQVGIYCLLHFENRNVLGRSNRLSLVAIPDTYLVGSTLEINSLGTHAHIIRSSISLVFLHLSSAWWLKDMIQSLLDNIDDSFQYNYGRWHWAMRRIPPFSP